MKYPTCENPSSLEINAGYVCSNCDCYHCPRCGTQIAYRTYNGHYLYCYDCNGYYDYIAPKPYDVEIAARKLANNWAAPGSNFSWYGKDDSIDHNWTLIYTVNRDSDLLTQANAKVIDTALLPFSECENESVIGQHFNHWACGWTDGYAIRVYNDNGTITEAFSAYFELMERLEEYPVLDDDLYSQMEYDDTSENIDQVISSVSRNMIENGDLITHDDRTTYIHSWLWDNDSQAVEPRDGFGGYPSDDSVINALESLGLIKENEGDNSDIYPYIAIENPVNPCGCRKFKDHTCVQFCGHSYGCACFSA